MRCRLAAVLLVVVFAMPMRLDGQGQGLDAESLSVVGAGRFGAAVAVATTKRENEGRDEDFAVIGAPLGSGAVYVFVRPGDSEDWLKPPARLAREGLADIGFGFSVAISADAKILAVGAPRDSQRGTASGAVYLYQRSGVNDWVSVDPPLTGNDTNAFDLFGFSVALDADGNTLVVGAPLHDAPNELGNAGAAYVFRQEGNIWRQEMLTAADAEADDQLGFSVAVEDDGDTILVGAPQPKPEAPGHTNNGKVYLFSEGVTRTEPLVVGEKGHQDDLPAFGFSVGLDPSGFGAVVGAPGFFQKRGAVYRFDLGAAEVRDLGEPFLEGPEKPSGAELGISVAVDGPYIVAGARRDSKDPNADNGGANREGCAYFGGSPGSSTSRKVCGEDPNGKFKFEYGRAVAVRGATFLVGAPPDDDVEGGTVASHTVSTDLEVFIERVDATVIPGVPAHYRVKVENHGDFLIQADLSLEMTKHVISLTGLDNPDRQGELFKSTIQLGPGEERTYEILIKVDPAVRNDFDVIARIGVPDTVRDRIPSNNERRDSRGPVHLDPQVDLEIVVAVSPDSPVPGRNVTFTVTVTNLGPSTATEVTLTDEISPGTVVLRSCVLLPKTPCKRDRKVDAIGSNATASFTLKATIPQIARGKLTYRADLESAESNPPEETLTPNLAPQARLLAEANPVAVVPGSPLPVSYQIFVSNQGPSASLGARVRMAFPSNLTAVSWTCSADDRSSCEAGASLGTGQNDRTGSIDEAVDLLRMGRLVYTIRGIVPAHVASNFSHDVIVLPETDVPGGARADVVFRVYPTADLAATVSDLTGVVPGNPLPQALTIKVVNPGPSDARRLRVSSVVSPDLESVTWTCVALNGSCTSNGTGNVQDTASLRVGGTLTYTVHFLVDPGATGSLTNQATVVPDHLSDEKELLDPRDANNHPVGNIELTPVTDLVVSHHEGPELLVPGNSIPETWTFEVSNAGPSDARSVEVRHVLNPVPESISWTCTALRGSCRPNGQGEVRDVVHLQVGGRLVYTVHAVAGAGLQNDSMILIARARVTAKPKENDPRDANNVQQLPSVPIQPISDLAIVRHEGPTTIVPGSLAPAIYTLEVTNAGPSDARSIRVTHQFTPGLAVVSWACTALNGSCGIQGEGNVDDLASLRVGGRLVYSIKVLAGAEQTGSVVANAHVDAGAGWQDPRVGNNTAPIDITLTPVADLAITQRKEEQGQQPVLGDSLNLIITVTNAGPSDVSGATVATNLTGLELVSWSCSALRGSCKIGTIVESPMTDDAASLRAGGVLTYTVMTTVSGDNWSSTAGVSIPAARGKDPRDSNDQCVLADPGLPPCRAIP